MELGEVGLRLHQLRPKAQVPHAGQLHIVTRIRGVLFKGHAVNGSEGRGAAAGAAAGALVLKGSPDLKDGEGQVNGGRPALRLAKMAQPAEKRPEYACVCVSVREKIKRRWGGEEREPEGCADCRGSASNLIPPPPFPHLQATPKTHIMWRFPSHSL